MQIPNITKCGKSYFSLLYKTGKHSSTMDKFMVKGQQHINKLFLQCIIRDKITEQVHSFNYLSWTVPYGYSKNTDVKLPRFQQLLGTIKQIFKGKVKKDTVLKFYKILVISILWLISVDAYGE